MSETSRSTSASGGVGLPALLTLLFVGLKLTGYIDWSWWWVLSPIPIAIGIGLIVLIVIATVMFLLYLVKVR